MDCGSELNNVIAANCEIPALAGTYGEVILIPYSAIDRARSVVADDVISEIALKTGRKAYSFTTFDNAPLGAPSLVAGTYINSFQHDLTLRVFVKREEIKAFLNSLANARVVAILKNKELGEAGEVQYEAYGWDSGLVMNPLTSDTSMADGVVYEMMSGNDDISKERSLPKSVWDTDLATTEAMLASLTAEATGA